MIFPLGHISLGNLWDAAGKHRKALASILSERFDDENCRCLGTSTDDVLWRNMCRFAGAELVLSNMGTDLRQLDWKTCLNTGFSIGFLLEQGIDPSWTKPYRMWNLRKHPDPGAGWMSECEANPKVLYSWTPEDLIDQQDTKSIRDRIWQEPGFAMPPILVSVQSSCISTKLFSDALSMDPRPIFDDVGQTEDFQDIEPFDRWRISIPKEKFQDEWEAFWEGIKDHVEIDIHADKRAGRPALTQRWVSLFLKLFPEGRCGKMWSEVIKDLEGHAGEKLDIQRETLIDACNKELRNTEK